MAMTSYTLLHLVYIASLLIGADLGIQVPSLEQPEVNAGR